MIKELISISPPIVVADNATLERLCSVWQTLPMIALDTEFVRVDTFFPRLGLIQVGDGEHNYLLDPLQLTDWAPFVALLAAPGITKVLHSCSEDLVVFKDCFNQLPTPLFDTQRAAAFLGFGYSISYQNLVKELLEIEVSKDQTRSDWLQRPLSDAQLEYAALDVAYLPAMARHLQQMLISKGRWSWAQEDFAQMLQAAAPDSDETVWQEYYLGLGGAWRLNSLQLAALQRLCVWREKEARQRNKPRNWIARDNELIAIATALPPDRTALANIFELPKPLVARDGSAILALIQAPHTGPAPRPELMEQPLNGPLRAALKRAQAEVKVLAETLAMAPELLARKKQLMPLVLRAEEGAAYSWPTELSGWRQELLESPLRHALQKRSS